MSDFLRWVGSAIIWTLANAVYIDMHRKGVFGFRRFAAFWLGFPWTLAWLVCVAEGSAPVLEPPPDDEEALLREVIRDREERRLTPDGEAAGKD